MASTNDFMVYQTVFYDSYGFPKALTNEQNQPMLRGDINGNTIVITDMYGKPKVVMDNYGVLHIVPFPQSGPIQMVAGSQHQLSSNLTKEVAVANVMPVESENHSSQTILSVKRDDIYKKVKKLGVDNVKQLLFYDSVLNNYFKIFINFDEDDAFNFLTDQIVSCPNPIYRFDTLVSIKTYGSIPDSFLNWFSDDLRAGLYFSSFVDLKYFQDCFYGEAEFLYWIKSIIKVSELTIESGISIKLNININQKIRDDNIRNLLIIKKMYLNNRTTLKKIKWFDEADIEQVNWAYEYLHERKKIVLEELFFPKTVKDKYNLVLASIDIADDTDENFSVPNGVNTLNLTQRSLFIYKMHRAWDSILSTRKKAEQKSKRSIIINQNNFGSLSKLSSYYKLTPTKMVNKLIEDEFSLIDDNSEK